MDPIPLLLRSFLDLDTRESVFHFIGGTLKCSMPKEGRYESAAFNAAAAAAENAALPADWQASWLLPEVMMHSPAKSHFSSKKVLCKFAAPARIVYSRA